MSNSNCANIIVLGHTGAGKSSFINYLVGQNMMTTGVGKPVTQNFDCYLDTSTFGLPVRLFDSKGFEVGEYAKIADDTINFINKKCNKDNVYEWIHTVFYCINRTKARVDDSEITLIRRIQSETLRTPHIVLTNCDGSEQDSKMKKFIFEIFGRGVQIYTVSSVSEKTRRGSTLQFGRDIIMEGIFETLWLDMLRVMAKRNAKLFTDHFQSAIQEFQQLITARMMPEKYDEAEFKSICTEVLQKRVDDIKTYNKSISIITDNDMNEYVSFLNKYGKNEKFSINKKVVNLVIEHINVSLENAAKSIERLYFREENPMSVFIGTLELSIDFLLYGGVAGMFFWGVNKVFDSESDKRRRAYNRAIEQVIDHIKGAFPSKENLERDLLKSMDDNNRLEKYFPNVKMESHNTDNAFGIMKKEEVFPATVIKHNGNRAEALTVVKNRCGIHKRPSSVMVQTACKFDSKITLTARGRTGDAKSILMVMSMGLIKGTEMKFTAEGSDALEAIKALTDLVDSKFGSD